MSTEAFLFAHIIIEHMWKFVGEKLWNWDKEMWPRRPYRKDDRVTYPESLIKNSDSPSLFTERSHMPL